MSSLFLKDSYLDQWVHETRIAFRIRSLIQENVNINWSKRKKWKFLFEPNLRFITWEEHLRKVWELLFPPTRSQDSLYGGTGGWLKEYHWLIYTTMYYSFESANGNLFYTAQGAQFGYLWWPRIVGWGWGEREVQEWKNILYI